MVYKYTPSDQGSDEAQDQDDMKQSCNRKTETMDGLCFIVLFQHP